MSTESLRQVIREDGSAPAPLPVSRARHGTVLVLGLALLAGLSVLSMFVGSGSITWSQTWDALTNPGDTTADVIVTTLRLPRTLLAVLVGAALGIAGVVMQAITPATRWPTRASSGSMRAPTSSSPWVRRSSA